MKKLLSLLSVLMVGGSSTLTVVACSNNSGSNTNPDTDVNANVKTWSQQSSNIAKSIILGKTDGLNTNNILENGLKNNINNITNAGTTDTGASYTNFTKAWGYNGSIEGISDKDFNSNTANTLDNNAKNTENSITKVLNALPAVLSTFLQPNLKTNTDFSNFILSKEGDKYAIANLISDNIDLSSLNKYSQYITYIPMITGIVSQMLNQFKGFDPKTVLGNDYYPGDKATPEQIQKALFDTQVGKNPKGWIANYHPNDSESTIDSVTKNSDILKGDNQKLFQNWDQVALFKDGTDLNNAIKTITKNMLSNPFDLSDLFQSSITFDDNGKATGFNKDKFAEGLANIYKAISSGGTIGVVMNIISLAAPIIQLIKYKILGFKPTENFTTISTSQPTNGEKGIININDIMNNINKILLTKDGFTKFFTNIFFPEGKQNNDDLFLGLDVTCTTKKGSFALEQVITPIESQIVDALNFAYDNYIDPIIEKNYIKDIFNKIASDLKSLTTNFDINIKDIDSILKVFGTSSFTDFLKILFNCKNAQDLQNQWVTLWETAGLQKDKSITEFVPDSFLSGLHNLFYTTSGEPEDLTNLTNFLTTLGKCVGDGFNTFIDKINERTSKELDFNNKKLWLIEDSSIKFQYDKESNQSTISYNLTYKGKTYQVSVVVNTNAHDDISNSQKVWLKSLVGLN